MKDKPAELAAFWIQQGERMERVCGVEADDVELLRELLLDAVPEKAGGRAKPVLIFAVDQEKYGKFVEEGAAKPIDDVGTFKSAVAASKHIGRVGNPVGSLLAAAERDKTGDPPGSIEIRGLTLMYATGTF